MNISLSRSANYTTQQRIWDVEILGPLTNSRILHYEKLGRYGEERKLLALQKTEEQEKNKQNKKQRKLLKKVKSECLEGLF